VVAFRGETMTFVIKLGGLLSACGGPMLVMDRLKDSIGKWPAFWVGFLPVGLMIMGAFHLPFAPGDRMARRFVELGRMGMLIMVGMQLFGISVIVGGLRSPALSLYVVGIATGLVAAVAYQWAAATSIARDRARVPIGDPHDHRPIEPS
jgi:hypothetical protein